jgi:hypothetical protein
VELIEHWWNSKAGGLGRQDVFVRRNPAGQYEVEHRSAGRSALREYPSREQALIIAEALRVDTAGWRDLTGACQH